jgi:flagellar motor switch protein FliN/FliY
MSDDVDQEGMADEWAAAMAEQEVEGSSQNDIDAMLADAGGPTVSPAPMAEFTPTMTQTEGAPDLDVIMDIPVRISMEVGNTEISIRNLLQLNQGSVIEMDRLAGEPLDVLVNGTLIAHGEVVVVNEKFGIRMTDVISPSERIKKLR